MSIRQASAAPSQEWEEGYLQLDTPEQAARKNFRRLQQSGLLQHLRPEMRVLDLCCGRGPTLRALAPTSTQLVGLDLSCSLLRLALHEGFRRLVCADSSILPFDADSFDVVIVQGGLHHLTSDQFHRALSEIDRVLKPGGYFVFTEPANTWALRLYIALVDTPLCHLTSYTRTWRKIFDLERQTYFPWLKNQGRALVLISQRMELLRVTKGLVTLVGLARSRKSLGVAASSLMREHAARPWISSQTDGS